MEPRKIAHVAVASTVENYAGFPRVSQGFPVTCLNRLGAHDIPQFGLGDHMEVS